MYQSVSLSWVGRSENFQEYPPCTGAKIGSGQFGDVFEAKFRGNLKVAAKQLKTDNEEESEKVLEEFFNEIKTMKGLNHPNLIQLFAFTTGNREGNFMIQEFMAEGDLKNYLQKLKKEPQRMKAETKIWSKLLTWNIEVARGMERLESLKIVHRDLAARYLKFLLCKSQLFSGTSCWTSFSGRRLQTLVLQCSLLKGEGQRGRSCLSNGLPLRHFSNRSSQACKQL